MFPPKKDRLRKAPLKEWLLGAKGNNNDDNVSTKPARIHGKRLFGLMHTVGKTFPFEGDNYGNFI
jgi:hypothetical protein